MRNGRRGIQVTAAGDVTVEGNTLTGQFDAALLLSGGASGTLRPLVSENAMEQGEVGIALERTTGGTIARNARRANMQGMNIVDSEALTIAGNEIAGGRRSMISGARDLQLTENVIGRTLIVRAVSGTFVFTKNRFVGEDVGFGVDGRAVVLENRFQRAFISGGTQIDVERNEGKLLQVEGAAAVTARQPVHRTGQGHRAGSGGEPQPGGRSHRGRPGRAHPGQCDHRRCADFRRPRHR